MSDIEVCLYVDDNKPVMRVKMMMQDRAGINIAMKSFCDFKVMDVSPRGRAWP